MEITSEILDDYADYCHQRLTEEFGTYSSDKYDPIYLYQRYKCRIIEQRKRTVFEASDLVIHQEYSVAYNAIVSDISNGCALKKYQSRKLKTLDYDDDMLSHWGVQHFHLGNRVESDDFVSRTGGLLFIHFAQKEAHIIGIFNHASWCRLDIIEKIHENWPQELATFKSGSDSRRLTEDEYKTLRKKHANTNVRVKDGTEYLCLGMGVTSNGVPIFAVFNSDQVIFMFNRAFELIKENIQLILDSDPEKQKSKNITIGMEVSHETKAIIYKVKETDFKFTLSS
ncbi:MAG: hypothetical protein ACREEM_40850 [Blastocatellia bacterium]